MKVTISISDDRRSGVCTVTREAEDKRFYGDMNAAGESALLYHMKNQLNKEGWDFIKKRMWKDGHLMDNMQQYLRQRKPNKETGEIWCIYNGMWQIKGANDYLNEDGEFSFIMENLGKTIDRRA